MVAKDQTGPKFSKTQRGEVKSVVASLDRRGYTQQMIVRVLDERHGVRVSQTMVHNYLKQIREAYAKATLSSREQFIAEKVAQYEDIRREAWEAYDRSKLDQQRQQDISKTVMVKEGDDPNGLLESAERMQRILTIEGRLPENAYLVTIMKTLEAERELRGFDPPKETKSNVNVQGVMTLDWGKLEQRQQVQDATKLVDERVKAAVTVQPAVQQVQIGLKELSQGDDDGTQGDTHLGS